MKAFLKWMAVIAAGVLLSAFLAPILFDVLPYKFERIFNRLIMIFTLCLAVWAVKARKLSFPSESMKGADFAWSGFMSAFAAGFLTLLSVSVVKMGLGIVRFDLSSADGALWAQRISMSLLSALVIGFIEELFFRGLFFTTLQKKMGWPLLVCVVVTNIFYALVHFTGGKKIFIGPDPGFKDSLKLLTAPFHNLMDWSSVLPGAFGLFIFGVVLTLLLLRTGSLYPCIGLHAGCVFFLKMDGIMISHEDRAPLWVFGGGQNYDGLLGWTALVILGGILLNFYKKKEMKSMKIGRMAVLFVCAAFFLGAGREAFAQEKQWVSFSEDESSVQDNVEAKPGVRMSSLTPVTVPEDEEKDSKPELPVIREPETAAPVAVKDSKPAVNALVQDVQKPRTQNDLHPLPLQPEPLSKAPFAKEPDSLSAAQVKPKADQPVSEPFKTVQENASKTPASSEEKTFDVPKQKALLKDLFPDAPVVEEEEENSPQPLKKQAKPEAEKEKKKVTSEKPKKQGPQHSYLFSEHLQEAQAYWISDATGILEGNWKGQKITFSEEAPEGASIFVQEQPPTAGGVEKQGIALKPSPEGMYRIRFSDVHAVSRLVLRYGFEDVSKTAPPKAAVYIRVWLGGHPLKRIRVFNEKDWKEESLDIGPAVFLKTPTVVTFEVTADDVLDRNFNFFAEVG